MIELSDELKKNFMLTLRNLIVLNFDIEVHYDSLYHTLNQHFKKDEYVVNYIHIEFLGDKVHVSCSPNCYYCNVDVNEIVLCLATQYDLPIKKHLLN